MSEPKPPRRLGRVRRWLKRSLAFLTLLVAALAVLVASLPWLAGRPEMLAVLNTMLNEAIAPGRLELDAAQFSWNHRQRLGPGRLLDGEGRMLASFESLTLNRGLVALIANPADLGDLVVEGLNLVVERTADGHVNLVDALKDSPWAISKKDEPSNGFQLEPFDPGLNLTVKLVGGRLKLVTPELVEPLVVDRLDAKLVLAAAPAPITLELGLAQQEGATLAVQALLATAATSDDTNADTNTNADAKEPLLSAVIQATNWPLTVRVEGLDTQAHLDGRIELRALSANLWSLAAQTALTQLVAEGTALQGDRLALDRVELDADLLSKETGLALENLVMNSPVARLTARFPDTTQGQLQGRVDLAALAHQVPHALRLLEGSTIEQGSLDLDLELANRTTDATDEQVNPRLDARLAVTNLRVTTPGNPEANQPPRTFELPEAVTLTAAVEQRDTNAYRVETITAKADFLDLKGSGDLETGVTLSGTFDLGGLTSQIGQFVDLGDLAPQGRAGIAATLKRDPEATDPAHAFAGWLGLELRAINLAGLIATPIERPSARIDLWIKGSTDERGAPAAWSLAKLEFKTTQEAGRLQLTRGQTAKQPTALELALVRNQPTARGPGRIDARLKGSVGLDGMTVNGPITLDVLRLDLQAPQTPRLNLEVTGRYEPETGRASLQPLRPGDPEAMPPPPLAIAPEGIVLTGLNPSDPQAINTLEIEGGLYGDLNAIQDLLAVWLPDAEPGSSPAPSPAAAPNAQPTPEPVAVTLKGRYTLATDRLDLDQSRITTRYVILQATGSLNEATHHRIVNLSGQLIPRPRLVQFMAESYIEPQARLKLAARPFQLTGSLVGGPLNQLLKGLEGEVGVDLVEFDAFGLKLEQPAPLVVLCRGGQAVLAPIRSRMNGGEVEIHGFLTLDDPMGLSLGLRNSSFNNLAINEEVSDRLLAYLAPFLKEATEVRGAIQLDIERGIIPLASERDLSLKGRLQFRDVTCRPGSFTNQLVALAGADPNRFAIALDQPVELTIAQRRVVQQGLQLPITPDVTIDLAGWVGFDQTLALQAAMPITPAMLGGQRVARDLLTGKRIVVPIRGTLSRPQIDPRIFEMALKEIGGDVLQRGLDRGLQEATRGLDRALPPELRDLIPLPGRGGNAPNSNANPNRPGAGNRPRRPNTPPNAGDVLNAVEDLFKPRRPS